MKKVILIILATAFAFTAFSQENDIWYVFTDEKTGLKGFKDAEGNIKIEPQYQTIEAQKLDKIIAVLDQDYHRYYLTKSRQELKKYGVFLDKSHLRYDCENEGFIRFENDKGKIGIINAEGEVVIPAEYNRLSKSRNGLIVALKGAKKVMDEHGEHYFFEGGKSYLIDVNHGILIEDFDDYQYRPKLNYYSLKIEEEPSNDLIRESFLGKNGKYYSFINYKKEFAQWFEKEFLKDLSKETLIKSSMEDIEYLKFQIDDQPKGADAKLVKTKDIINKDFDLIKKTLSGKATKVLNKEDQVIYDDYVIYQDYLAPYSYSYDKYEQYYDNCFTAKEWKYPLMSVVIESVLGNETSPSNNFEFLRTDDGYKLINIFIYDHKP